MYIVDVRCHIGTLYCLICIQYVDLHITILIITMNLLPQNNKPTKISEKEELFLQNLFSNGGHVVAAAENAGYDGNDDPDVPVVEGTPEEQEAARQQAAQILKGFGFNPSQFGG